MSTFANTTINITSTTTLRAWACKHGCDVWLTTSKLQASDLLPAAFHGCSRPDGADPDAEELGVYAAVRLAEVNATGSEMGQGL